MHSLQTPTNNNKNIASLSHTPPYASKSTRSKYLKTLSGSKVSNFEGDEVQLLLNTNVGSSDSLEHRASARSSAITSHKMPKEAPIFMVGSTPTQEFFPHHASHQLDIYSRSSRKEGKSISKKNKVPTPLNLEMISPPPSHIKPSDDSLLSQSSDPKNVHRLLNQPPQYLNSPLNMLASNAKHNCYTPTTPELPYRNPRRNLLSSINAHSGFDEPISESVNNIHKNIKHHALKQETCRRRPTSSRSTKNYSMNVCFICNEPLNSLLVGEKVVEMSCQHQCHQDCLLASLLVSNSSGDRDEKPVHGLTHLFCTICKQMSKPVDETANDEISKELLVSNSGSDLLTELGNFHVSAAVQSTKPKAHYSPITPVGQLIHSDIVSQHGFMKTPIREHNSDIKKNFNPIQTLIAKGSLISPVLFLNPQVTTLDVSIKNLNEPLLIPHILNVHLPERRPTANRDSLALIHDEKDLQLKRELSILVMKEFLPSIYKGHTTLNGKARVLQMFDVLELSYNDENYNEYLIFLFTDALIFEPLSSNNRKKSVTSGSSSSVGVKEIALGEVYSIVRLQGSFLISFKNSSIPEIYMKVNDSTIVLERWMKILKRCVKLNKKERALNFDYGFGELGLLYLTCNTFELLQKRGLILHFPAYLYSQVVSYYSDPLLCHKLVPHFESKHSKYNDACESDSDDDDDDRSETDNNVTMRNSTNDNYHTSIRSSTERRNDRIYVLVINVINFNKDISSKMMCEDIKHMTLKFLESRNKKDNIGIIVCGRDSENSISLNQGTFLGMINSKWDGIIEFLNNLRVFDCFDNPSVTSGINRQFLAMSNIFEILQKLFIMNAVAKRDSTLDCYFKKYIHIINNDYCNSGLDEEASCRIAGQSAFIQKMIRNFKLDITQYNLGQNNSNCLKNIMDQHFEFDSSFRCLKYKKHRDIEFVKTKPCKIYDLLVNIKLKPQYHGLVKFQCLENTFGERVQIENNADLSMMRLNLGDFEQDDFKTFLIDLIVTDPLGLFQQQKNSMAMIDQDCFSDNDEEMSFIEFSTNWINREFGFINGDIYDSGKIKLHCISNTEKAVPGTSVFPIYELQDKESDDDDGDDENGVEFIDILLTAPLTSSRDSTYVLREIEMMIMDVVELHLTQSSSSMQQHKELSVIDIENDFKQLYSVIFAMSRNVQLDLPFFSNYMKKIKLDNTNYLSNYIEYLCNNMDNIIETNYGSHAQTQTEVRFKLYKLLNSLRYQTRV